MTIANILQVFAESTSLLKLKESILIRTHELEESWGSYQRLIEKVHTAIVIHAPNLEILGANPLACELLGINESEMLGRRLTDIVWTFFREDGTQMPFEEYPVSQVLIQGKALRDYIVGIYRKKSESIIWALVNADLDLDDDGKIQKIIVTFSDITKQRQRESLLREQAMLLDLAQDAIFVLNLNRRIIYWSRGAAETYGWEVQDALGKTPDEILHTQFPISIKLIQQILEEKKEWHGELIHWTRLGEKIIVDSCWSLELDEHGKPKAILEINRNITERKKIEEARRQAEIELEKKCKSLRDLMKS